MTDKRTLDVYKERATEYAAQFEADKPGRYLRQFMDAVPKAGSVLDLGCGTGGACAHMEAAGFAVTGMDASREMLTIARSKSDANFIEASFEDLNAEAEFDGIWANFSLLHAERSDMPHHLAAIYTALKPNGVFHLGLKTGSGSARDKIDRFYTYYETDELQKLLETAGFSDFQIDEGEEAGLAGNVEPFVIILCKKST